MVAQSRPDYLAVNIAGIPQALKDRAQWVAWRAEQRGGKWTKVPIDPQSGERADSTNPTTWGTFVAALAHADKLQLPGIGYVFSADDPYCGIDIDKCTRNTADAGLTVIAQTIVGELDSYTEETPSGTGIHIICEATVPHGKGRKNTKHGIEIYDRARFFTMTGHALIASPSTPQPREEALTELHQRLFPVAPVNDDSPPPRPAVPPPDDQALIDRAHRAKNAAGFMRLWGGDTSGHHGDDSSADLALCNHLAFWAGPDPSRIDRLFRASRLYRTKWEREDYRNRTIEKALEGRSEYYDWAERGSEGGPTFRIVGADERPDRTDNPDELHCTDMGNGLRLVARHGDDLRYCERWKSWLVWDGRRFARDDTGAVERRAKDTVRGIYGEANAVDDPTERKRLAKWAMQSEGGQRLREMIGQARTEAGIAIAPDALDRDPWILTVANGAIDLRTGQLQPARRADLNTKLAPVTFDPSASCPTWLAFLDRIMGHKRDVIAFLQRAVGYALTGDASEHCLFLLYGNGRNGKTTFVETIAALLGDYAQTTPSETLLVKREGGVPNDLARLAGARLVSASESEEGKRLSEALIKQLTGGDTISARFLHAEFFDFVPVFKLFFRTNHKPLIRGTDEGIWSRIRLVEFAEQITDAERDAGLPRRILAELPGILNWALAGCLAWQRDGLGYPADVRAATGAYRAEMDMIGAFLEECCVVGFQRHVLSKDLYNRYTRWSEENGERPIAQRALGLRLVERGFVNEKGTGGVRRWLGLTLD